MQLSFNYTGTVTTIDVRLKGSQGQVSGNIGNVSTNDNGTNVLVNFTVGSHVAPLTLKTQGIVVTPVYNPNVIGATRIEMVAHSPNGSTDILSTNYVPVVDNCS